MMGEGEKYKHCPQKHPYYFIRHLFSYDFILDSALGPSDRELKEVSCPRGVYNLMGRQMNTPKITIGRVSVRIMGAGMKDIKPGQ